MPLVFPKSCSFFPAGQRDVKLAGSCFVFVLKVTYNAEWSHVLHDGQCILQFFICGLASFKSGVFFIIIIFLWQDKLTCSW